MDAMPRSTAMQLTPIVFAPPTPPTPTPTPPSPVVAPTPPTPPTPPPRGAALSCTDAATQTEQRRRAARLRRLPAPPFAPRRARARTMPLEGLARSAEEACRGVDDSARLAFVSQLHARITLRLRSAKPLEELKASLAARFPLARVRTFSDCLDGTAGAELELPGDDEALVLARRRVRARPLLRALRWLSQLCLIMAILAHFNKVFA